MRIIELCLAKSLGGLELYFEKCSQWFHQSPHYSLSVALSGSRLENRLSSEGVPVTSLTSNSKLLSLFNGYKLANLIENHDIGIVHVHHKDDLLVVAFAKTISKKKFMVVHTRQMQIPHSKKDLWHKFIYKKIDLFITITAQLRDDAIKNIPLENDKIYNLYYGVKAPQNISPEDCAAYFHKKQLKDKFKIGIFSRIEHLKGQHLVIEAANLLNAKYPDISYHFFGDPMGQNYLKKLHQLINNYNIQHLMHFEGFHPNPLQVMHCFDIILLPSYNETFGLTLAEAMRSEVAVIGTKAGGVTEIIDHEQTGLLFEKDNYTDLSQQIERLYLDDDLRKKLANNGKLKADNEFDEEKHFKKLEMLLSNKIIKSKYGKVTVN